MKLPFHFLWYIYRKTNELKGSNKYPYLSIYLLLHSVTKLILEDFLLESSVLVSVFVFVLVFVCLCHLQMNPNTVLFPNMYDMLTAILE